MSIRGKRKSLKGFFAAKRMTLSEKESELISEFYFHVIEQNISSDKALGTFLFYARYSKKPGVDTLKLLQEEGRLPPTTIWYGNRDWMDREDCHKKVTELGLQDLVKYEIISPSSHQIVFNQPVQVAQKIAVDLGIDFQQVATDEVIEQNLEFNMLNIKLKT